MNFSIDEHIRTIPNWPKQGVNFKDITSLLQNAEALQDVADAFFEHYKNKEVDVVVGIEARGFIFGAILAQMLGVGFVPIRKAGKLPAETEKIDYSLEYGTATIEIHKDALQHGQQVVLIDDLIATGGSCLAACALIERLGANVFEIATVIDLKFLGGTEKIKNAGYEVFPLVEYSE